MLYMDKPQVRITKRGETRLTCHLVSDVNLAELHAFARSIGVSLRGFHDKPGQPHYDLIEPYIDRAAAAGAQLVSPKVIVTVLRTTYGGGRAALPQVEG